jgi:hypothetical protein
MDDTSRGGDGATFYRYRDAQGRPVLVDALSKVPSSARGSLESITLSPPASGSSLPSAITRDLHWPSFAAGAACVLVLGLVFFGSRLVRSRGARVALSVAVLALGAAAYFGWVRRLAGEGEALLASPAALIDDARNAVDKMNERNREQQRVLQELEAER